MSGSQKNNLIKLNENELESLAGGLTDNEMKEFYPNSTKENDLFYASHKTQESAGTCKRCGKRYTYCNQGIETGMDQIFSSMNYCGDCRSELKKDPKKILDNK